MSPTIVMRDGKVVEALGSPGGSTIITTVAQMLIDQLDFGMTLPEAMAAPRLSQRNAATTPAEPAFIGTPEAAALTARGEQLVAAHPAAAGDRRGAGDRLPRQERQADAGGGGAGAARRRQRHGGGPAMS